MRDERRQEQEQQGHRGNRSSARQGEEKPKARHGSEQAEIVIGVDQQRGQKAAVAFVLFDDGKPSRRVFGGEEMRPGKALALGQELMRDGTHEAQPFTGAAGAPTGEPLTA